MSRLVATAVSPLLRPCCPRLTLSRRTLCRPQMTAEHDGDTHAAYAEMGQKGGQATRKE